MRWPAALLAVAVLLQCGGCVVAATATGVASLATTTVATAGKVAVGTVAATGKVAKAALGPARETGALSPESAVRLRRKDKVVLVDAGAGLVIELPWQSGLQVREACRTEGLRGDYASARIFRGQQVIEADLRQAAVGDLALRGGDVIELKRYNRSGG